MPVGLMAAIRASLLGSLPLSLGFLDLITSFLPLIVPMGLLAVILAMLTHWTYYLFLWAFLT